MSQDTPSADTPSADTPQESVSADTPQESVSADTPQEAVSADTPDSSGEQSSSSQSSEESRDDEIKVRRFNDMVLLTGHILQPFRTIRSANNVQEALNDITSRTAILANIINLTDEDLELFSKRVRIGLKLKRIFEGTQWIFGTMQINHDFTWLFTGTPIDSLHQTVTGFSDNGLFVYGQYKAGLDTALQIWKDNGSDPLKRPAYYPLPDPALFINRFVQMDLIAKIFYKLHPEEIPQ